MKALANNHKTQSNQTKRQCVFLRFRNDRAVDANMKVLVLVVAMLLMGNDVSDQCLSFISEIIVSSLEILDGSVSEDTGARPTRKVSATIWQITAGANAKGVILDIESANESVLAGGAGAIGSDGAASGDCGTSGKDEQIFQ